MIGLFVYINFYGVSERYHVLSVCLRKKIRTSYFECPKNFNVQIFF
jgi:hypothetical protein